MIDLYIYYRVPVQHVAALLPRVRAMQAQVCNGAARCQLKRRADADGAGHEAADQDGCQTWMEVYPQVDPAFAAQLTGAVLAAGIAELIDGPRHTEIFTEFIPTELAPCA